MDEPVGVGQVNDWAEVCPERQTSNGRTRRLGMEVMVRVEAGERRGTEEMLDRTDSRHEECPLCRNVSDLGRPGI